MNGLKRATIGVLSRILPEHIKNSIFHLSFHLARPEFERFAYDYGFAPNMKFGLSAIAQRGFVPKTIVDVGAFEGNWGILAKNIWPDSCLVFVEPNFKKQDHLQKLAAELGAQLHCDLLGARDGQAVQFNVMESGSSILSERSPLSRVVETRCLRTLDSLLSSIEAPGLLKIDAQGYEIEILKGASQTLPRFDAVLLEIAIIEINEGAPLLHEVTSYMKTLGFVAYDILEIHRRPLDGALNQIDIVFVREKSPLIADKRHYA